MTKPRRGDSEIGRNSSNVDPDLFALMGAHRVRAMRARAGSVSALVAGRRVPVKGDWVDDGEVIRCRPTTNGGRNHHTDGVILSALTGNVSRRSHRGRPPRSRGRVLAAAVAELMATGATRADAIRVVTAGAPPEWELGYDDTRRAFDRYRSRP